LDVKKSTVHSPWSTGCELKAAGFIQCDITDKDKTEKSIVSAKPDAIIHAAAWTDVDGCEKEPGRTIEINEHGTKHVARAAAALNVPLMYLSTDFVFDGCKKTPYTENDTPHPINVYGRSKLEGEKRVAQSGRHIIVRTSWLFGTNGSNFVDAILGKAKTEKQLKVVSDQIGCPTYTKDLAKAIRHLLNAISRQPTADSREIWGIYHVSNKGLVSWFDYAKEIVRTAQFEHVTLLPITSRESARPAERPAFSGLDNSKFEKTALFCMRPWKEAVKEYINEKER
jgi:dTDP-4-dehydrorhamnose reductase